MRNYLLVLVSIFTLSFTTVTNAQSEIVTEATFDGFSENYYSFTTAVKGNEEAKTIKFSDVSAEILKQFDLKSETLIGKHFSITYEVKTETKINDDGDEELVEVFVLKAIRKAVY